MRALAKSKAWLECLPIRIRKCKRMAPYLERWEQGGDKAAEFMVKRESKDDILTDDKEE